MATQYMGGYKIDICFVIDATGSMHPIIDQVKEQASQLHEKIVNGLKESNKNVSELRLKVIDFADFGFEQDDAIHQSNFFTIDQIDNFKECLASIKIEDARGGRGGDEPENGLEALYLAMNSDWTPLPRGEKGRHIIVLFTDASPLALGERDGSIGYCKDDYPADIEELSSVWHEKEPDQGGTKLTPISCKNKRLILYVPEGEGERSWQPVTQWEQTTTSFVNAAEGLQNVSIDAILAEIVRSVVD